MGQHLATWVAHDLGHVSQVVRVMARQYSTAVGPWRASFYRSLVRDLRHPLPADPSPKAGVGRLKLER